MVRHFHEPAAEPQGASNGDTVLVKTGRNRDRVGKMQTADVLREYGKVVSAFARTETRRQSTQGDAMSGFGREEAQHGAADLMKCAHDTIKLEHALAQAKPRQHE